MCSLTYQRFVINPSMIAQSAVKREMSESICSSSSHHRFLPTVLISRLTAQSYSLDVGDDNNGFAGALKLLCGRGCLTYAGGQLSRRRSNALGRLLLLRERSRSLSLRFCLASGDSRCSSFRWSGACCWGDRFLDECHCLCPFVISVQGIGRRSSITGMHRGRGFVPERTQ